MDFLTPPKKFGGRTKIFVKNGEEKKSCSKLPEMARKLVENDFWIKNRVPKKMFVKNGKKSKMFKIDSAHLTQPRCDFSQREQLVLVSI